MAKIKGKVKDKAKDKVEVVAVEPVEVFTWVVINAHGERFEITAEDVDVDGGALVFSSGGDLVRAFGPAAWHGLELKASEPTPQE